MVYTFGPQVVVWPQPQVPEVRRHAEARRAHDPCPFVCKDCGERGEIKDRAEAPAGYVEVTRTAASFVSPKNRWKATR